MGSILLVDVTRSEPGRARQCYRLTPFLILRRRPTFAGAGRKSRSVRPSVPAHRRRGDCPEYDFLAEPHAAARVRRRPQMPVRGGQLRPTNRRLGPLQSRHTSVWPRKPKVDPGRRAAQRHAPTRRDAAASTKEPASRRSASGLRTSVRLKYTTRPESWCRRNGSIAPAFFDDQISSRQDPITEDFLSSRRKVWPVAGLRRRHRHNAADHLLSFTEFNRLPGPQPGLEPFRVSKLTHIDAWHGLNVPRIVSHCQLQDLALDPRFRGGDIVGR